MNPSKILKKIKLIIIKNPGLITVVFFWLGYNFLFTSKTIAATWHIFKFFQMGWLTFFLNKNQVLFFPKSIKSAANYQLLLLLLPITVLDHYLFSNQTGLLIIVLAIIFFKSLSNTKVLSPIIFFSLITSIIFQSLLAIFQFITQSSLLGYLFLGEPDLSRSIGLAKITLNGAEKILPYGTTAHPNILAGTLVIMLLIILSQVIFFISSKQKKDLFKQHSIFLLIFTTIAISLSMLTILLTFSFSAWLMLIIGIVIFSYFNNDFKNFHNIKKISFLVIAIITILTPILINFYATQIPKNLSLTRRAYLNKAAWKMFIKNPVFGVGVNNFTARVEEYSDTREVARFNQPAHHLGLLFLAENGLIGAIILIKIVQMIKNQAN